VWRMESGEWRTFIYQQVRARVTLAVKKKLIGKSRHRNHNHSHVHQLQCQDMAGFKVV
jgi:hypothetical protein